MSDNDYIPGQQAADLLQVSERTVQRYATGDNRRIRSRKYTGSKKLFYHRGDVETLADELGAARQVETIPRPKAEMMPAGQMLDYLRERDRDLHEAQRSLSAALLEIGQARSELAKRNQLEGLYQEVTTERDSLRQEIGRLRLRSAVKNTIIVLLVVFLVILVALYLLR